MKVRTREINKERNYNIFWGVFIFLFISINVYYKFLRKNINKSLFWFSSNINNKRKIFEKISHLGCSRIRFKQKLRFGNEVIFFEGENFTNSMKYYNSNKLKTDFQIYLLWRSTKNTFYTFFSSSLLIVLYIYGNFALNKNDNVSQYTIILSVIVIIGVILPSFQITWHFFNNRKNIQIKTLSASPKTYAWKDKNTLYLK